ncbi:MAG: manganese efflux pump MntP family protein [Bacteriovoracia bacterium]
MESLLLSFALGVDAAAVAFAIGIVHPDKSHRPGLLLALWFGAFQALMAFLGWQLVQHVSLLTVWAERGASVVFVILGVKLAWDAWHESDKVSVPESHRAHLLLAVATSIDAFAAGVALVSRSDNTFTISLIGFVAFLMTGFGAWASRHLRHFPEKYLEFIGAAILIFLGVKSLF